MDTTKRARKPGNIQPWIVVYERKKKDYNEALKRIKSEET